MKAIELTNGVIYFSFQTKLLEYKWANRVNCSQSGMIYFHSFPDGSFISLRPEFVWTH